MSRTFKGDDNGPGERIAVSNKIQRDPDPVVLRGELGNNTEVRRFKVNIRVDPDRKKVVELRCIEAIFTAGKDQLFSFELLQGKAFFFCKRVNKG